MLAVADLMVPLECDCRQRAGFRFIDQDEIIARLPALTDRHRNSLYWQVSVLNRGKRHHLGVIPDRLFGIEIKNADGVAQTGYFFLEADRGTMPITRQTFSQTSIGRKLLAYAETWRQGIHQKRFGLPRFRVVIVTTNAQRTARIIEACRQTPGSSNLFLVADQSKFIHGASPLEVSFDTPFSQPERLCDGI
jgi:hypothetical protein